MRAARPTMRSAIVKLDEGVSGRGNAVVDPRGRPAPGAESERDALRRRVEGMAPEHVGTPVTAYLERLAADGGSVGGGVEGDEVRSPSVQLRVTPHGEVELLSTHDQILGGPSGQSYLGCRFPANVEYGPAIMHEAEKVGKRFAKEGIVGRYALDFVVVKNEAGKWEPYAIEVNL